MRDAIREKVPVPPEKDFDLSTKQAEKVIMKKRNWSAPGPDRIVNFWWKRANCLHVGIVSAFQVIAQSDQDVPLWFTEGRTSLIPKPGDFSSENQRPITCLNTVYKWFTSCLLEPVNSHLEDYDLMEGEQRGAKEKCSGTTDNLLIDRMVCQDSQRGRRNISMAWIDVRKAYDSVSHNWLMEMFSVHRFPQWIGNLIERLSAKWNTRIFVRTRQGTELSERILFARGLPQGDALCPKLFTLCMNPIAWKLQASEGYRLSKPINTKITDLLYVDDLKVYAASKAKLKVVLREVQAAMGDIGLLWNEKKCAVVNVKRGCLQELSSYLQLYEQLLPTRLYNSRKTKTTDDPDARCRMCKKAQESVAHVVSGCSVLAQTKYLSRHNAALKIVFFELLKSYQLIEVIPPWYSPTQPKSFYENGQATVYWDVPVYADHTEVHANRVDAGIVDKENQTVTLLENREQKEKEKTFKYAPLRLELKQQYPGHKINQVNIIIDVLGGYSKELYSSVRDLLGAERSRECLRRMQKSVLSSSLNIARSFKVLS